MKKKLEIKISNNKILAFSYLNKVDKNKNNYKIKNDSNKNNYFLKILNINEGINEYLFYKKCKIKKIKLTNNPLLLQRNEKNFQFIFPFFENGNLLKFRNVILKEKEKDIKCLRIFKKLVNNLFYIHKKNIIHHDIKPENICIDKFYTPHFIDFGFSKFSKFSNSISGTLQYIHPNLFLKMNCSFEIDWWSLGLSFFVFYFGKDIFQVYGDLKSKLGCLKLKHDNFKKKGYFEFLFSENIIKEKNKNDECFHNIINYILNNALNSLKNEKNFVDELNKKIDLIMKQIKNY